MIGNLDAITLNLESLKEFGFINYYGSQRFGTRHVPTHHVGKQLLLGNWQEVGLASYYSEQLDSLVD